MTQSLVSPSYEPRFDCLNNFSWSNKLLYCWLFTFVSLRLSDTIATREPATLNQGPPGTATSKGSIVPTAANDQYVWSIHGMMTGSRNQIYSEKTCHGATYSIAHSTCNDQGLNLGLLSGKLEPSELWHQHFWNNVVKFTYISGGRWSCYLSLNYNL
jgi:hypothetical protein